MNTDIIRRQNPEEREFAKKLSKLKMLENQLAELESERTTLQTCLLSFERRYIQTLGRLYAELDAIKADIDRLLADTNPSDADLNQQAQEAKTTTQESAREANFYGCEVIKEDFRPSDSALRACG